MMVKRSRLFLSSILILVVFANIMQVSAVNTGFKINQLSSEEKISFISNINLFVINEEPAKKPVICFDVNSNRLIAIGQNTADRKIISIYSEEGVFQYGYIFNCSGNFGVEWDKENLNIYFVRSSLIVSVSPEGKVLDVFETLNTIENNSYINHFIHSTKRKIEDTEYFIRNDLGMLNLFAPSYSQIIVKSDAGFERVIYDVSSIQLTNIIVTISMVCVLILTAALVVWRFIRLKIAD